jgi:hypothetical protein
METLELGWQGEMIDAMSNTGLNCEWSEVSMIQLGQWSVGSNTSQILLPGKKTSAGLY